MEIDDNVYAIHGGITIRATKDGLRGLERGPVTRELIEPHFHCGQNHIYTEYVPDELIDEFLRPRDVSARIRTQDSFNLQGYYIATSKTADHKFPSYKNGKAIVNPTYQGIARECVFSLYDSEEAKEDSSLLYPEGPIREAYKFYEKHGTTRTDLEYFIAEYDIASEVFCILKRGGIDVSLLKCEIDRETYLESDDIKGELLGYDLAFDRGEWSLVAEIQAHFTIAEYLNENGLLIDYEIAKEFWEIISLEDDWNHKGWWTIFRISEINSAISL